MLLKAFTIWFCLFTILNYQVWANDDMVFKAQDTIVVIGDSITHDGSYLRNIYDFYATRFPNDRIVMYNKGIIGDTVAGAIKRLEWDVLPLRPNKAVILLGMNDLDLSLYVKGNDTEEYLQKRENALSNYRKNLEELMKTLKSHEISITIISPSPYDQTATFSSSSRMGYNDALGQATEIGKKLALENQCQWIDFYGPMTAINNELQKKDPKATIIGSDRVHPQKLGNKIMAYLFAKQQGFNAEVSNVELDTLTNSIIQSNQCEAKSLIMADGIVSFEYRQNTLPLPVDSTYKEAEQFVPLTNDLNRSILTVKGLKEENYLLEMDGLPVNVYSNKELDEGVNIAVESNNPDQIQAKNIQELNIQRAMIEKTLRDMSLIDQRMISKNIDISVKKDVEAYLEEFSNGSEGNLISAKTYLKMKPKENQLILQINQLIDQVYANNNPSKHNVQLKPIPNKSKLSSIIVGKTIALKTSSQIAIDGQLLGEWDQCIKNPLNKSFSEKSTSNAYFMTMWDENYLYFGANVQDEHLNGDNEAQPWNDDSVELYLDGGNEKSVHYDSNDTQIVYGWKHKGFFCSNPKIKDGILFAQADTPNGFSVEMAIPWNNLEVNPEENRDIGIDVAYNDDIDGYARESQLLWTGSFENYLDTSDFGVCNLSANSVEEINEIKQILNQTIALDIDSTYVIKNQEKNLLNQQYKQFKPVIMQDKAMVPINFFTDHLGGKLEELTPNKEWVCKLDGKEIRFTVGKDTIMVDGHEMKMDLPVQEIQGIPFIPLRATVEAIGKSVLWHDGLILINDNELNMDFNNLEKIANLLN